MISDECIEGFVDYYIVAKRRGVGAIGEAMRTPQAFYPEVPIAGKSSVSGSLLEKRLVAKRREVARL